MHIVMYELSMSSLCFIANVTQETLADHQDDPAHKQYLRHLELESKGNSVDEEKSHLQALWTPWNRYRSLPSAESRKRIYDFISAYTRMLSS